MQQKIQQAQILLDALPYIKRYNKKTIVIKYGGAAQINPELKEKFAQDIVLLYLVGISSLSSMVVVKRSTHYWIN